MKEKQQLGQVGIRSVLDTAMCTKLRSTLETQLREYDTIETELHGLAHQRGWDLAELAPAERFLRHRMTRLKLTGRRSDSRIAGRIIRKNTNAMILALRQLHRFEGQDQQIQVLAQKLLDCATAGIHQMKQFL